MTDDTITMDQLMAKLEQLKADVDAGTLKHGEYDQHLARMIGELRDRKLEGDRATVNKTLTDALSRGIITPAVKSHLEVKLGLA